MNRTEYVSSFTELRDGVHEHIDNLQAQIDLLIAQTAALEARIYALETVAPSPFIFGVPAAPVADSDLAANQIAFWSNDGSNLLAFKMKNSTGVLKTGTVALT